MNQWRLVPVYHLRIRRKEEVLGNPEISDFETCLFLVVVMLNVFFSGRSRVSESEPVRSTRSNKTEEELHEEKKKLSFDSGKQISPFRASKCVVN